MQKVLKTFGLTDKESELYIFLARHSPLRSGEIAKGIHTHRVEVYRMLGNLQKKGVIERTLESPTRFTAVPLEKVLDAFIKARQEETAAMERTKESVLIDWKNISRIESKQALEKFVVVEGNKKIYSKILQMTRETKNQLSVITSILGLARADSHGILDAMVNHPLREKIFFRFLTELTDANIETFKTFFKRIRKTGISFKGRNPTSGLSLSPRMALRDREEILVFIRPTAETLEEAQEDVCLWTNCKTLVESFSAIFEDLWTNSTEVKQAIADIGVVKSYAMPSVIDKNIAAPKTYEEILTSAKNEIMILTSSEGLTEMQKCIALFKEIARRRVTVKVMAPITNENQQTVQRLSKYCSIRHTPTCHLESTLVDGKHLVQSRNQLPYDGKRERIPYFGTFTVNNQEYVNKTKETLDALWRTATILSISALGSVIKTTPIEDTSYDIESAHHRSDGPHRRLLLDVKSKRQVILEKDVLEKIINAKKYPGKNWPNEIIRYYGSNGLAVIHPPVSFNLPDMTIWANHINKQSSFGAADNLLVFLWLETPEGNAYVPVAFIGDNPKQVEFYRMSAKNTPSEHNAHLVKREELQIRMHGNTLFAGWTIPIPLFPPSRILPPSCLIFEGYGPLTTSLTEFRQPSGIKVTVEANGFDAFVTFFHPASKYSAPGTDGRIHRDLVTTFHPL